jgi:hypothetical protein
MSVLGAALRMGRARAAARMRSTWTCLRTEKVFDNKTGKSTTVVTQVYDGPARLHSATNQAQREIEAGATVTLHGTLLSLPAGAAPAARIGDEFVCVDSPDDPSVVGVLVRVIALPTGEQTTADRYAVEREVPS